MNDKIKKAQEALRDKHLDWEVILETLNWAEQQLDPPRNSMEACLAIEKKRKEATNES